MDLRVTQAGAYTAYSIDDGDVYTQDAVVLTAYNIPTDNIVTTQSAVNVAHGSMPDVETTLAAVNVAVAGKLENRRIRAWTFSLDGHDFYLLRLGETFTLVYDLTTQTWTRWHGLGSPVLRQHTGINWIGISKNTLVEHGFKSNVVAGDDTHGLLWVADPESGWDEAIGSNDTLQFPRKIVGGLPMRLRQTEECGAIYVTAATGDPHGLGTITLRTSDDYGKTFHNHGTITANPGEYDQEFAWRSLGLIRAPGRIFEITDSGATIRIDSIEMKGRSRG